MGIYSTIVYSHGFGVRKDDRGLFTDIAAALPNNVHVMFDYNQADEATGDTTVTSLDEQAAKLGKVIAEARKADPHGPIDLVCHSQGCIAAALLKPEGIRKAIFLAPPAQLDIAVMMHLFAGRPGSDIDINGISRLKRADGSTTSVPPEYWNSVRSLDAIAAYNDFASVVPLLVIHAGQDEIIGSKDFSKLSDVMQTITITADHGFHGEARQQLITIVVNAIIEA